MFETQTRIIQTELFMTNSDRYSPDDYNADQIDEDAFDIPVWALLSICLVNWGFDATQQAVLARPRSESRQGQGELTEVWRFPARNIWLSHVRRSFYVLGSEKEASN